MREKEKGWSVEERGKSIGMGSGREWKRKIYGSEREGEQKRDGDW